ncbi:serine carboxypeptidase [Mycena albidolilacea]|uniref:Carboxypeptidase n=1 Tax=Mycena albidolilacea TaxID=1033008 RepID=A0AAD6Z2X0_9AGAR|nr:serine carboxypeptidase [Mycena albidolilacea]
MSLRTAAIVALVCAGFSLQVVKSSFTALRHPEFPGYGVRIKKSNFCDEGVGAYTGYIDIQVRHFFLYFFESRSDPDTDDICPSRLFISPGCLSGIGLFMELGPCRVVNANSNQSFFVDQPIGVGFSYADYDICEEAAQDIAVFVAIFFAHFSKFQGRGFHMSGESYAGRYIPVFAAAVYDQNPRLIKAGIPPINLTYEIQCAPISLPPVQNTKSCVEMKAKESCVDQVDLINCGATEAFCGNAFMSPYIATGLKYYDLSKKCKAGDFCYTEIDPTSLRCSIDVRVLIYAGTYDFACNWIRNEAWTLALEWSGQAEFGEQPLAEWAIDGKRAGRKRYTKGLTFATVGPHGTQILFEVPYDKPKESLEIAGDVDRWTAVVN